MESKMNVESVKEAIAEFDTKFKRPGIDSLVECFQSTTVTQSNWSSLWADKGLLRTYTDEPCVYFFFNNKEELQYIGKAEILGYRMSKHFAKNSKWYDEVKTIGILPVPRDSWFEIVAIEAYLIDLLRPPANSIGKNSRRT
ncbi:hypothetical protein CBQ28_08905 [Pseudoalteromonas sp. GCY]|nr:hypothetical protein CBQ28_08905 [Pseudoalteromonas sp. GCY]